MTDTDFLAAALEDGMWHSHTEILNLSLALRGCGLTIHSRAADLRRRGHVVETRLERDRRGRTLSFYRLTLAEAPVSDGVPGGILSDSAAGASASVSSNPALRPVPSLGADADRDPHGRDGDTLLLFACEVDESAGLRGAYWDDAA